jgi:hypothetical protein
MLNALSKIFNRPVCFVFGVILALLTLPVVTFFKEFLFGFEIQSMASFPYYHMARLYTNPGLGDQTLTLEVDGKSVWTSGDAAGGDLKERLIWDKTGRLLTLELNGESVIVYDAQKQKIEYKRW